MRVLRDLPLGALVEINGDSFLVWHRGPKRWSSSGYSALQPLLSSSTLVRVLTPESIIRSFVGGYCPAVYESGNR